MDGAFLEAVRSLIQPCTFLFIVPTMTIVIAASARWYVVTASIVAAIVGGWAFAGNWWSLDGLGLRVAGGAFVVLVLALAFSRAGLRSADDPHPALASLAVAGAVVLVSAWWRPCVGEHLGLILNETQQGVAHELLATAAYMLGLMLPVVATGLFRLVGLGPRTKRWTRGTAAMLGTGIGLALVGGQHTHLVAVLTDWTSF